MTLPLELGGIRDPAVQRAFQIIAQQFPIVTTGGGGGGGAPSGPAGGVLGGTYPNPGFAVDMATQAELDAHTTLTTTAHGGIVASTDSRLTDARTPTAHHTTHEPGGTDAMAVDAVAATGSLRTLGTGAQQAAAGNDSRLTNARTPTAHQTTHQSGGTDALSGNLDAVGRTNVSKAGSLIGTRRGLNLIEGTSITMTVADNAANERVDVTINSSGAGGPPTGSAGGDLAGTYPNPTLAARVYWALRLTANTGSITASGGTLAIAWTQEDADPFNVHAASATTVTPGRAGVYLVGFQVYTGASNMNVKLQKNSTDNATDLGDISGSTAAGQVMYQAQGLMTLTATDTLRVFVTNSTAAAQVVAGNTTNYQASKFWGYWIGP